MKHFILASVIFLSAMALAHDEGHGPKLTDTPKQGGKIAPVIAASDASKGIKAALIYKSELVREEDGTIKVFFYDKGMNPLPETQFSTFDKAASAIVEHVKKGKITKTHKFSLELKDGVFAGKLGEKPATATFNIDVKVKEGSRELLAAFDGLETRN